MKSFPDYLVRSPFFMAPMAGITDSAYRLMAKKGGARLCYTEMVSVSGIHYKSQATLDLLQPFGGMNSRFKSGALSNSSHVPLITEGPLAVQLFGSDPQLFVEAISVLQEMVGERLAFIDINMACPVKKVRKIGAGAELLRNPQRAQKIVTALKEATHLSITAKMRMVEFEGTTEERREEMAIPGIFSQEGDPEESAEYHARFSMNKTIDFAKMLQEAGIDAIALHGRSASQFYHSRSNLEAVAKVGRALRIPLIASGDMFTAHAGVEALSKRGISGVMFARGALGNPWIFSDAERLLHASSDQTIPKHLNRSREEKLDAFIEHVGFLVLTDGQILRARTLFCHYTKDFPQARKWRSRIMSASKSEDFIEIAQAYKKELKETEALADRRCEK